MRSAKATKRYLLTKEWIDADTCKSIVIVFVLFLAGSLIAYLSSVPGKSKENRKYSECNEPRADPQACLQFLVAYPEAASNHDSGENNQKAKHVNDKLADFVKNKRDLNAQEGMWRATNVIALLTIAQVFIGGIGLLLLYRTLGATKVALSFTQDTLEEARETARQAALATKIERAKIFVEKIKVVQIPESVIGHQGPQGPSYQLKMTLKNYGRTAASGVVVQGAGGTTGDGIWAIELEGAHSCRDSFGGIPPDGKAIFVCTVTPPYMFGGQPDEHGDVYPWWEMVETIAWCRVVYDDMAGDRFMDIFKYTAAYISRSPVDSEYTLFSHQEFALSKADRSLTFDELTK